jgi:small nuclear ribonucleoprotein D3
MQLQGHVVTLEITSGVVYRGKLLEGSFRRHHIYLHPGGLRENADVVATAEDNMNVQLKDITVTARDGRVSHLDQVYIRGSHVKFFIVPDMLRYIPTPHCCSILVYVLMFPETRLCSVRAACAVEVLVLLVVRRQCRGRGDNGGVDWVVFFSSWRFLLFG